MGAGPVHRGILLEPGGTVVEGTFGNTGIGLALVCNAKNYNLGKITVFCPLLVFLLQNHVSIEM